MKTINPHEPPYADILAVLERVSDGGVYPASYFGERLWKGQPKKSASRAASEALRALTAAGLVEDDGWPRPPKCYRITPEGREAIRRRR